jgi:hypothetical protein
VAPNADNTFNLLLLLLSSIADHTNMLQQSTHYKVSTEVLMQRNTIPSSGHHENQSNCVAQCYMSYTPQLIQM